LRLTPKFGVVPSCKGRSNTSRERGRGALIQLRSCIRSSNTSREEGAEKRAPELATTSPTTDALYTTMETTPKTGMVATAMPVERAETNATSLAVIPRRKAKTAPMAAGRGGPIIVTLDVLESFFHLPLPLASKRLVPPPLRFCLPATHFTSHGLQPI